MEVVAEVKTLMVHMKCDKCGKGLMLKKGNLIHKIVQKISILKKYIK